MPHFRCGTLVKEKGDTTMSEKYTTPEMCVFKMEQVDVITTSQLKNGGADGSGTSESLDDLLNDMF